MLFRKAVRSVMSNKRSYFACVFLISIGITMYIALNTAATGLGYAMEKFYRDYNLADVFAKIEGMPITAVDSLAAIEGVEVVEARYVFEARVEVFDSDEIITLRLVSVGNGEGVRLNDLLVTGSDLSGERDIIVNPAFFSANGLSIGHPISIFVEGREYVYNLCGTALNPEYAYITKSPTEVLPDESGFGIGYITADSMSRLTNTAGISNDIVFKLSPGYSFDDVKIALEDSLAPYGIRELIDKEDQLSYSFLKLELKGIESMASSLPMLFVIMAVVVLYLMLKRVIEQDRTQIGTLKAFGYSSAQIITHYLFYGGITGLAGGILGYIMGYFLSGFYLSMFLQFFMLPDIPGEIRPEYLLGAAALSVGGGVAGSFIGAFKVLGLNPAEAMRPESPKPVKSDIVGRIKILRFILTSRGSMALRGISRNWLRSGFVVVGIMFSYGLLAVTGSFDSLIDKMIYGQFEYVQLYSVKISLKRPVEYDRALEDAYAIDQVTLAEGLLEIPAELVNRHIREGVILTGMEAESSLYKVCDTNTRISYPPPRDSLVLSNSIADKLDVKAGDVIYISSPLKSDDTPITVSRVIEQNLGGGCYMEINALSDLFGLPKTATSVILNTDDLPYLKDHLKSADNVSAIDDKDSTLKKYQDLMAMYTNMYVFMQVMGVLVAFAIIYNTSTISLSERKREYATLRVIGLSVSEVCEILSFEYWVLCVAAMALGVPFTWFLNGAMNSMMDTSLYSMPSTLPATAYVTGVVGCVAAVMLSNFSAKRMIGKFDMVEVLKERE